MSGSLAGIGIAVTRDERQAPELSERLKALGASVVEFPLLEIRQTGDLTAVDRALAELDTYDWVIFASANAADYFLRRMQELRISPEQLKTPRLAAVGEKTKTHLEQLGFEVAFAPTKFSGEHFAAEFCQAHNSRGLKILWPRANVGKLTIKEKLEGLGAQVDAVVIYETHLPAAANSRIQELVELIRVGKVAIVTLTSGQAARNLHQLLETANSLECLHSTDFCGLAVIGTETAQVAANLFGCKIVASKTATIPELVRAIEVFVSAPL
jgi:uroporphyrinogen-III synthase